MAVRNNKGKKIDLCKSLTINMVYVSMQYLNKDIACIERLTKMTNKCLNLLKKSTVENAYIVQS